MKKISIIIIAVLLFTACSSVMLTGRKQIRLVPESEVLATSLKSYKSFIDTTALSRSRTQSALVKKVGKRIATAVTAYMKANGYENELKNFAWEYNLVQGKQANAFCMPGGKIVVYEGILPYTQTETGLAVVLGHEVAHAIAHHSSERLSQQLLLNYGASLTNILLSKKSSTLQRGVSTLYGIGTKVGVSLPNSRKQELEADKMGLVFMAMAGYNPEQAVAFWQRMSSKGGNNSDFLSTHPSDTKRIAQIRALLPEVKKYYKK